MTARHSITKPRGLIALQAPAKLGGEGEMPTRLVMLRWGRNETAQGPKIVGMKTLQAAKLWDKLGFGEVAIDFNHNTVPGSPAYQGEPAPIAAMAIPRVIEGEGLVFDNIRWTPEGIAHRAHYPDLSPAIMDDADGEVYFVHSGAVTRNGATQDLHLFSAESIPDRLAAKLKTLSAAIPQTTTNTTMIDLIKKLLKLPADATEADVTKALEGAIAAMAQPAEAPSSAEVKALTAALTTAMKALKDGTEAQIKALSARFDSQLRDTIVAEATAAGRVVPKEWLPDEKGEGGLPLEQLRTLCATLPETVPLDRRTPRTIIALSADASGITATDREVMRHLGITEERWKKSA